jgi:hypothetical protein
MNESLTDQFLGMPSGRRPLTEETNDVSRLQRGSRVAELKQMDTQAKPWSSTARRSRPKVRKVWNDHTEESARHQAALDNSKPVIARSSMAFGLASTRSSAATVRHLRSRSQGRSQVHLFVHSARDQAMRSVERVVDQRGC